MQLVLQAPSILTWQPLHLQKRMRGMAVCLGLGQAGLVQLLQERPQLLVSSSHLARSLQLLRQLLVLASSVEDSCTAKPQQPAPSSPSLTSPLLPPYQQQMQQKQMQQQPQQQQLPHSQRPQWQPRLVAGPVAQAPQPALDAARALALAQPLLLEQPPDTLAARLTVMQARSGLPVSEIARAIVAHPKLLTEPEESQSSSTQTSQRRRRGSAAR
jgi:hypothetical protein